MIFNLKKYFRKKAELDFFRNASTEEVFTRIYRDNKWGDTESRSGKGASLEATRSLRSGLPDLLRKLNISSMLDIPCGDFHWMKEVALPFEHYIGADIVHPLLEENQRHYGNSTRQFLYLDLLKDSLPAVDAIFCRECLVHLSYADIGVALRNIRGSGATWLLTTHFPQQPRNKDIVTGKHHSLNFTIAPFNWPAPVSEIVELYAGKRRGNKCLSAWRIADLPITTQQSHSRAP